MSLGIQNNCSIVLYKNMIKFKFSPKIFLEYLWAFKKKKKKLPENYANYRISNCQQQRP